MTETERRVTGQMRRCVFTNIANGLPVAQVMADLRLSEAEVDRALEFVRRKLRARLVAERQPPIPCATIAEMRANRIRLLVLLVRLGDLDLSTDLVWMPSREPVVRPGEPWRPGPPVQVSIGRIITQAIDHPEMVEGVSRRMAEAIPRRRA